MAQRKRKDPPENPAELVYKDVRRLHTYPRNARTHPREQIDALKKGLRRFGWTRPILIDEHDGIVAGHGIRQAAIELWEDGEEIARTGGPWMAPTLCCAGWSEDEKRAYILFDNRSAEMSGWDDGLRVIELTELRDAGFDLSLTGHDEAFVADLVKKVDEQNEPPPENEPAGAPEDKRHLLLIEFENEEALHKAYEEMRDRGAEGTGEGIVNVKVID